MIYTIQALRGLGAVMVLAYHAFGGPRWGAAGVDIFFPISGLVMVLTTYKARGECGSVANFTIKRLIRIVPIYWAATLALFLIQPGRYSYLVLGQSLTFIPTDAQPNLPEGFFPIIAVGWTLNIEMLFYLVFAGGLALPKRLIYPAIVTTILAIIGIGIVIGRQFPIECFYLTNPLMIEFVFGIGIGIAYMNGVRINSRWTPVAAMAVLSAIVLLYPSSDLERVFAWGLPCAISVALFAFGPQPKPRSMAAAAMTATGDISYALYVTHVVTIIVLKHFQISAWLIFAIAIAVATGVHLYLERPTLRLLQAAIPVKPLGTA